MKYLLVGFLAIALLSCATIVKGTTQLVSINCNVSGAKVFLDNQEIGTTPFAANIKKGKKSLTIEKEGYATYTVPLTNQLDGMFWGNIITGGTIGSLTDVISGAAYQYSPSSFHVELRKDGMSESAFRTKVELRKYSMVHLSHISVDVANHGGPYSEGLIDLFNQNNVSVDYQDIKVMIEKSQGNQVAFGNQVVALLDQSN